MTKFYSVKSIIGLSLNERADLPLSIHIMDKLKQGLICSFGVEDMQLVQPSKFFSVTIFRTRSIGSIGMPVCELGLCCYF